MSWFFRNSCLIFLLLSSISWGFKPHKSINKTAVYYLPNPLFVFYKQNVDYIEQHAVDADIKKFSKHAEIPNHFIDLEFYQQRDSLKCQKFSYQDLKPFYQEEELQKNGVLPWYFQEVYNQLVKAFRDKNESLILKLSADIGHYIADAHVPFHTTENYDGQLTNQEGIHALFETQTPMLFIDTLVYEDLALDTIHDVKQFIWEVIFESHDFVLSILEKERILRDAYPSNLYSSHENGNVQFDKAYVEAFHKSLNGVVEDRYKKAIFALRNVWFSAWLEAGSPQL